MKKTIVWIIVLIIIAVAVWLIWGGNKANEETNLQTPQTDVNTDVAGMIPTVSPVITYVCNDETVLNVNFVNNGDLDSALFSFDGVEYDLPSVTAEDGVKYERDGVSFWTKSETEATFEKDGLTRVCEVQVAA